MEAPSFMTIRSRRPGDGSSLSSADSTYGSGSEASPSATHDISRVSYHVKHLESFAQALEDSATRAFPNRGRSSQRYTKVQALMLHWKCDDLFVLPELEDLEKCLREYYSYETDIFAIPSENAHLELMLKIGDMVKKHESEDTLFVVYYGGHARIDESRQSTWCATRHPNSPWLQWSAIQTLLERSPSDVLILLDCCAGAASATFPTGKSITETISASSWDAIAPDPGRYSFTNALIEVLQEWRPRTFSAAMLHAEVLARLKHPRPILINGKHFEARSTPVHFMMTSNHRAPSIEIGRIVPETRLPPSPPQELPYRHHTADLRAISARDHSLPQDALIPSTPEPDENQPHVMISLALEDDQRLDINAWEQWLGNFPALAKYVKVQGVFKSHSTLLLLSLPVMVWDLLPDDPACAFIAFIRSNNLLRAQDTGSAPTNSGASVSNQERTRDDTASFMSGTTISPPEEPSATGHGAGPPRPRFNRNLSFMTESDAWGTPRPSVSGASHAEYSQSGSFVPAYSPGSGSQTSPTATIASPARNVASNTSLNILQRQQAVSPTISGPADHDTPPGESIARTMIINQSRISRKAEFASDNVPEAPQFSNHVVKRLEQYFQQDPDPGTGLTEYRASHLGVEPSDINLWFHHRREQARMTYNLQSLRIAEPVPEMKDSARMILPGHLNTLLEIYPSKSILIVDLRSPIDFERSHLHEAINLRAPLSFVQNTSLEMIEDTFMDDESRRSFNHWSQYRCVVFYDRVVEFDWECPVADALYDKFRRKGWPGQCFILKGHYREFSASFDKYISGSKMSKEAKEYLDGLRQKSSLTPEEVNRRHQQYDGWLRVFENEDGGVLQRIELIPARKLERRHAVEQHQKDLEVDFEARFPALYKKARAMGPRQASPPPRHSSPPPPFEMRWESSTFNEVSWGNDDDYDDENSRYDRKARLVGPLVSGLENMREAVYREESQPPRETYSYNADKLDLYSDDYDEIDPKSEGLKNDPLFQSAGAKLQEATSGSVGDDTSGKKGGRTGNTKRAPLWERLRTGGK
ncbi:hypothetical protein B0H67DRAFT_268862 [Lasiosphaeris hirsuta]|uniref:Homeobox domain-containing protein n=1 Tax=Lasiosphaeris hirsuta TaxID=260670 RepID=A0AA40A7U4_9PEZI|nr:hypothetical protein B0H67DRAFT_268862 [Lasiosphaeris hirsuta]